MKYTTSYTDIEKKYQKFTHPMIEMSIGGSKVKVATKGTDDIVISSIEMDLSVGYEASMIKFDVYKCFDTNEEKKERYNTKKLNKYKLNIGEKIEVSAGYNGVMQDMFTGFIAQIRYVYRAGDAQHVEVVALDIKGIMMSNCYAKQFNADSYCDALKKLFATGVYTTALSNGIVTKYSVENTPDAIEHTTDTKYISIEMVAESDYEFVVKAAKHFGYEFFVRNGEVLFREARKQKDSAIMKLALEKGMEQYDISYDITGIVESVEVRGVDIATGKQISQKKKISGDFSTKGKKLISGTSKVYAEANIEDSKMAAKRAEFLIEEQAYKFGSLEAACIGIPELMPGNFIEIDELGDKADNVFYIKSVRHMMSDSDGYRTTIVGEACSFK